MSNASLKEQLQAVASQLSSHTEKKNQKIHTPVRSYPKKFVQRQPAQKPKPTWLNYVQYGVELLRHYFPNTFKDLNEVKPLKIGIKQDLIKSLSSNAEIVTDDKACMLKSLAYYVNTFAYHKCMLEGAMRIDLEGKEVCAVTTEEAKYSLDKQKAKSLAKQTKNTSTGIPTNTTSASSPTASSTVVSPATAPIEEDKSA